MGTRRRHGGGALPSLGPALLAAAQADLAVPVVEYSPRVVAMLAGVGLVQPHDWNAAAVTAWVRDAAGAAGRSPAPIAGAATGEAIVAQLVAARRWIARAQLTAAHVVPGMIAARRTAVGSSIIVVGVVSAVDVVHGRLTTIQGDAGEGRDRVAVRYMGLADPLFLGCGSV